MAVWALGINHHTAPLDVRGRFAFALDRIAPTLRSLRESFGVRGGPRQGCAVEAAILSTCNRTEIYCAAPTPALEHTLDWLACSGGTSREALRAHAYMLQDGQVARHAFRVASGLDSMVLGEAQILGQMKTAVRAAASAGVLGSTLNQLFQRSFAVAKAVRSSTAIGAHSISMAAAAVRLAGQLFEDLSQIRVLLVGAGEMVDLVATHFAARRPRAMVIANRTLERGEKLAARVGAQTMRLADLPEQLHLYDAVVSCTASSLPIIGLGAVERAIKKRRHRPMFMVDLAVPRDVEPEVGHLGDVYLYTVDDLAGVVRSGQARRQGAVAQAEAIIDQGVQGFVHWLEQRRGESGSVALIRQLQQQTAQWRAQEVARAQKRLRQGEAVDAVLESLARGLAHKMLHGTLAELHRGDSATAQTVSRLFLRTASHSPAPLPAE